MDFTCVKLPNPHNDPPKKDDNPYRADEKTEEQRRSLIRGSRASSK